MKVKLKQRLKKLKGPSRCLSPDSFSYYLSLLNELRISVELGYKGKEREDDPSQIEPGPWVLQAFVLTPEGSQAERGSRSKHCAPPGHKLPLRMLCVPRWRLENWFPSWPSMWYSVRVGMEEDHSFLWARPNIVP
jgi:hypothetical protein